MKKVILMALFGLLVVMIAIFNAECPKDANCILNEQLNSGISIIYDPNTGQWSQEYKLFPSPTPFTSSKFFEELREITGIPTAIPIP